MSERDLSIARIRMLEEDARHYSRLGWHGLALSLEREATRLKRALPPPEKPTTSSLTDHVDSTLEMR